MCCRPCIWHPHSILNLSTCNTIEYAIGSNKSNFIVTWRKDALNLADFSPNLSRFGFTNLSYRFESAFSKLHIHLTESETSTSTSTSIPNLNLRFHILFLLFHQCYCTYSWQIKRCIHIPSYTCVHRSTNCRRSFDQPIIVLTCNLLDYSQTSLIS